MIDWRIFKRAVAAIITAGLMIAIIGCVTKHPPVEITPTPTPLSLNDQLLDIDRMSRDGRHDDALAALEPLIAAHPETQRPRGLKTDIYLRKGDHAKALELQKEIIAAIPDKWYAHYHLGLIYLEFMNQYQDATGEMEQAQALLEQESDGSEEFETNKGLLLMSLAKAEEKQANWDKSIAYCDQILSLRPNDPWATTFRAMLLERKAKTVGMDESPQP